MATYLKVKTACDFLDNIRARSISQGLAAQLLPMGRSSYILTVSNGMTYEMRAS